MLFRLNEIIFRLNELLFRFYEMLFRFNEIVISFKRNNMAGNIWHFTVKNFNTATPHLTSVKLV